MVTDSVKETGISRLAALQGIVMSFISPLMVFFLFLRSNYGSAYGRFILTVLITFYGSTMVLGDQADGYRHRKMVVDEYLHMSLERFLDDTYRILTLQLSSSSADIYKHILSFISGSILQSPGLFFVFVAFIYGYFFSGVLITVLRNFAFARKTFVFWVFFFLFLLTKNVEGINTVRTWTGLWVLVYGVLRYHETRQLKYLLLILATPLIHFGYLLMSIPTYIVLLFGDRPLLYGTLFVVSSFTNFIDPEVATGGLMNTPLGEQKVGQYFQSERLEEDEKLTAFEEKNPNKDRTWYKKLETAGYFNWPTNLLIYGFIFFGIYRRFMNGIEKHLFSIGILTLAGSNTFFFITAASNRMSIIGLVFVLAAFMLLMQRRDYFSQVLAARPLFGLTTKLAAVLVLPKFVYLISFFLNHLSFYFLFGPFVVWADPEANISVLSVIKSLL